MLFLFQASLRIFRTSGFSESLHDSMVCLLDTPCIPPPRYIGRGGGGFDMVDDDG